MKNFFIIFLIASSITLAQRRAVINGVPRDTSYTLFSAAKKIHKKFPDAKLAADTLPSNVKEGKNIVYAEIGKRKLHLNVFYHNHRHEKKYPGILMIHGGGWSSGDTSLVIPMAERISAKGFVTVTAEYRLSPEALYPAAVYDLKAALRWMRANAFKYDIDTNKIAVYGCSAGGQLAALIGTTNDEINFEGAEGNNNFSSSVQAIVNVDGVVDFFGKGSQEITKPSGKPSAAQVWFGVSAKENPKTWKEAGAFYHTSRNTPPIIFINSDIPRFHAGRDEMIEKLKSYGIYFEVHTLPGTIHTFWLFHPWFDKTLDLTVGFLDKVFERK